MALPTTEHYTINKVIDPEHDNLECYGVTNTETEVVEYYDNLLPRAYEAMVNMEVKYTEMEAAMKGSTKLGLVSTEEVDSGDEYSH